ncbi:hypothetical protein [Candidatus Poriferisodalis sp.]|uniref:hypothetical protein n=1 Tax=Candidatus Poriferisodalis sp. TaxID=3101277 RepID=UPI003B01C520
MSSDERVGLVSGGFVAPHSSDDAVGELPFAGSSGFVSGLALAGLAGEAGDRFCVASDFARQILSFFKQHRAGLAVFVQEAAAD